MLRDYDSNFTKQFTHIILNFNEMFNYYFTSMTDVELFINFMTDIFIKKDNFSQELIILDLSYDNYIFSKV